MTNTFTLEELRAETTRQFAPFTIGMSEGAVCNLRSVLRLSADERKTVKNLLDKLGRVEDVDSAEELDGIVEIASQIIYVVADKPAKLLADLQDSDRHIHVALLSKVLSAWMETTEAGEA